MPVHGYKIGENYWAGQMVTFACDTGYHLEGPTNRLCLENGSWSEIIPTCEKITFNFNQFLVLRLRKNRTLYNIAL